MGIGERLGDGGRGEGIRLDENSAAGGREDVDHRLGGAVIRGEVHMPGRLIRLGLRVCREEERSREKDDDEPEELSQGGGVGNHRRDEYPRRYRMTPRAFGSRPEVRVRLREIGYDTVAWIGYEQTGQGQMDLR
jgi:hypothetical protein